jgi:hypothetical protein
MTVETLLPASDDSGWVLNSATFDDINNTIAGASGTPYETDVDNDVTVIGLTDVVAAELDDAATVNSVTVKIRAKDVSVSLKDSLIVDVDVGGGGLGTFNVSVITDTYVTYEYVNALWDLDHTLAQLNAMTLIIVANQTGKGETATWQIDEIEVDIDYTEASSAQPYSSWLSSQKANGIVFGQRRLLTSIPLVEYAVAAASVTVVPVTNPQRNRHASGRF